MDRFRRILVYVNPSIDAHPAVSKAQSLARPNRAEVTLMAVIPETPWYAKLVSRGDPVSDLAVMAKTSQILGELALPLRDEGLVVHTRVETGRPFIELTRCIIEDDIDLLVKVAEAGSAFKTRLFGSTAMHLVRKTPCPVWLVDPRRTERPKRILAAIDPNPDREEGRALAHKILEMASSLAEREKAELHVVHAWRVFFEGSYRRYSTTEEMLKINEETRLAAKQVIDEAVAPFAGQLQDDWIHLVAGDPQAVIPGLVSKLGVDLIVMGTVGRTGIQGLLIGNVAEAVISQADSSVLAVKPDGFVSPLANSSTESHVREAA